MNLVVKNIIFWVVMATTAFLLWVVVKSSTGERPSEKNFTEFINEVNKDNVRDVTIAGTEVTGVFKNNQKFKTTIPANYPDLCKTLQEKNVNVTMKDNSWVGNGMLFMIILVDVCVLMFTRQMQIKRSARLMPSIGIKCRFCGLGLYQRYAAYEQSESCAHLGSLSNLGLHAVSGAAAQATNIRILRCFYCGHIEWFEFTGIKEPKWWTK